MTLLLERLLELVPAVKDDRKASQIKIVDEATKYLNEQKPLFLEWLREKRRFNRLRRQLMEHSTGPDGKHYIFIY